MKRREFLKFSSYLLGFLSILSLSFGKEKYKEINSDNYKKNNNKETKKYDGRGNLIYHKDSDGWEYWKKYDRNNNWIYIYTYNGCDGHEQWADYDKNNRVIHYKSSRFEYERWYGYDENNKREILIAEK